MKKYGLARSCVVSLVTLLFLLSPLSALPMSAAGAQEAPEAAKPEAVVASGSAETIDSGTMGRDAFPDTKSFSREDILAPHDPYSKTTENPDGTLSKEIFTDPINWRDAGGNWHEIDSTLIREEADGYSLANASGAFKFRLAKKSGQGKTCSLELDGKKFRLHLLGHGRSEYKADEEGEKQAVRGGKPETPEETPEAEAPSELDCVAEGNQAYYYDSKRGYSLEFLVFGSTIEQLIKLDSPSSPNTFTFKLDTDGVDLEKDEAGNLRALDQESGRELFMITSPIMMDSNVGAEEGDPAVSCDISMDITKDKDGKANLTICADPAWLADPARVYPVYIDPAWANIYPYYDLMGGDKTNRGDTFCNSANPGEPYGSYFTYFGGGYVLNCGYVKSFLEQLDGQNRILIGADVRAYFHNLYYDDPDGTKYNAGAIIDEAWFKIWCSGTINCTNAPIALEYPTSDWAEDETTWSCYPTVSSGTTFTIAAGACKLVDMTAKAQSWVKGTENGGAANRGFSLRMNSTSTTIGAKFNAREYGEYGPHLRIYYTMIGCPYNTDEIPTKFTAGETKMVSIYLQNTGGETWKCDTTDPANPYRLGFYITDRSGKKRQLEARVKLPRDIKPWETVCLAVPVTVPATTGDWRINFDMVKEGAYWFSSKGVNPAKVDIQVASPGAIPQDAERTASAQLSIPWMSHASMGGMAVNLVNGSTSFSASDLSVSGRGVPFGLSRTYASTTVERIPAPLFGPNWFSGLDVKVKDYGSGYLAYYDASGKSHLLVQAKKANTFVCPEGYFFKAESNPEYTNPQDADDNLNWKYKVVGTGGVIQHFDDTGKLIYVTDASRADDGEGNYKNKTKINYNFDGAGNIQVVDASGRTFTVTLSGGKISSLSEDASWAGTDEHEPRTVSYEYNGPGGRLSKITLNPGDHWGSITYSATEPNLITQAESKVDGETTRKSYFEYSAGKLAAYRNPRSSSSSDDTYKSTITYGSGSTVVSSPQVSNDLGMPNVQFSTKYIYNAKGETTNIYSGVNADGSGGLGRMDYEWNAWHQVTKVTDYQDLTTPLGSVYYVYDGKGNASKVEDQLPGGQTAVSTADYAASRSCSSNLTAATSPDGDKAELSYNSGESYFKGTDMVGAESVVLRDPVTENGRVSVTLPAPLPNLLQNASAEKDDDGGGVADGWTTWEAYGLKHSTTYQVYSPPDGDSAAAGRKVQRLRVQGNTGTGDMAVLQSAGVSKDNEYTLSFDYRSSPGPAHEVVALVRQRDAGGGTLCEDYLVLKPSATWSHQAYTFRSKAQPQATSVDIALCLRVNQPGQDVWADFDAVQLVRGSKDTAFNHVENSDFQRSVENGSFVDPADWTVFTYYRTQGTWSTYRYVSPAASLRLCTSTGYSASQAVNVKKNTRYLVSGYVYAEGEATSGGAFVSCGSESLYKGSSKGYYGQDTPYVTKTGKWTRLFKVVNSGNADALTICLGNNMVGTGNLNAYFDDISVTELPDDSEITYDASGNYATQVKSPRDAGSYYTGYVKTDPVGNVLEARDARSSGPADGTYLFSYTYNELSQLTSVVSPLVHDALGQEIQSYSASYDYDTAGRLLWFLDNNTEETSFEYNQANQITAKTDPNARTVQVEYNEAGGVKKVAYPNGWEVYYAYRQNGALDKVAFKDPQNNVTNPYTFTYDGTGRLTQVSDAASGVTLNFTFDMASRLTAASSSYAGGFSSSYAYTKGGRLTSLTYSKSGWKPDNDPNNKVTYAYRATGEHSVLTLPNLDTINYAYEDRGRLSSVRYVTNPASTTYCNSSSFTYDAAARLASVTHNFHDSGMKMSYEYDPIGNVTRSVQDSVENLYAYDELSRLTSWTEKEGGQVTREEKYHYDGNGNIMQVEKMGSTETHAYDAANQCTDTGFSYDECGNLTSDGDWTYEYDRGSRLVSATNDTENLKVVFAYDPQGRRYSKTAYERDGQGQYTVEKHARFYHYDAGGNILAETDAAGSIIRSYAYDISGHPIAFTQDLGQGQKTFYIHTNARGDVVCITDDAMDWVKKFTYDPWGNITSETARSSEYEALTCPYAYAGYFLDAETGLYYMPARYYSPEQRRFLTKDPHQGSKSQPITLNPYQYCRNNPVNRVDPSGQYDWDAWLNSLHSGGSFSVEMNLNMDLSGCARFASAMSSFRSSVASSMSNIGGLVSSIRAGVSSINASILQLNMAVALQRIIDVLHGALSHHSQTTSSRAPIATGSSGYGMKEFLTDVSILGGDLLFELSPEPYSKSTGWLLSSGAGIYSLYELNNAYGNRSIGPFEFHVRRVLTYIGIAPSTTGTISDFLNSNAVWYVGKKIYYWLNPFE